ncbi:MAG: ribonuclease P protein component [Minisyncoccia bacterium]
MLPKKNRINLKNLNNFLLIKPQKIKKTPYFDLFIYQNNILENRCGVLLSKKIITKATQRNKIKRIIFSIVSKLSNQSKDFLFKPKPEILKINKNELKKIILLNLN